MSTQQGSLALLNDPVAQQLLQSTVPARLAYTWSDGTPRLVPIWFHWNDKEFVLAGPSDAPKMKALRSGDKVALTIDSDTMPYKVLTIRGFVRVETVDGLPPEYSAASRRVLGAEQGQAWANQIGAIVPRWYRIFVVPEWAGILDFETRLPNAIEHAMERAAEVAA